MAKNSMRKGIFWIVWEEGFESISEGKVLAKVIECDETGSPSPLFPGNSKDGSNYVHMATWKDAVLDRSRHIRNRPWNYFPRGRIEVSKKCIRIFANPVIDREKFQGRILEAFDLQEHSLAVKWITDHSEHYVCLAFS